MAHELTESRSFEIDGKTVVRLFITVGPRKGQQVGPDFATEAEATAFSKRRSKVSGKAPSNPFKDLTKP